MFARYELVLLGKDGKPLNVSPEIKNTILIWLTKLTGYQLAGYPSSTWDMLKWPDYVIHMREISSYYKDIVFLLNREGESPGDLKKEYFFKGSYLSDEARIQFKDSRESICELISMQESQSTIGELLMQFEGQTDKRAKLHLYSVFGQLLNFVKLRY